MIGNNNDNNGVINFYYMAPPMAGFAGRGFGAPAPFGAPPGPPGPPPPYLPFGAAPGAAPEAAPEAVPGAAPGAPVIPPAYAPYAFRGYAPAHEMIDFGDEGQEEEGAQRAAPSNNQNTNTRKRKRRDINDGDNDEFMDEMDEMDIKNGKRKRRKMNTGYECKSSKVINVDDEDEDEDEDEDDLKLDQVIDEYKDIKCDKDKSPNPSETVEYNNNKYNQSTINNNPKFENMNEKNKVWFLMGLNNDEIQQQIILDHIKNEDGAKIKMPKTTTKSYIDASSLARKEDDGLYCRICNAKLGRFKCRHVKRHILHSFGYNSDGTKK